MNNPAPFLSADKYVDFNAKNIQTKAAELFANITDNTQKARTAYEFVRDEIPHSFDIAATVITATASDVLFHQTGICHAKANLLAALLRSQGIPAGFCFQHITLEDDDSNGYCVHAYNAVWLENKWIKLDARGNKPGVNAQFSQSEPILAFPPRPQYNEYFWHGIYAKPHSETMIMLEQADSLEYVFKNIPCKITLPPDIKEIVIQKANAADLEEILKLQYLAYQSEAKLRNNFEIPPLKQTLEEIRQEHKQSTFLKTVNEKGEIIGSVRAVTKDNTTYIGKLIVHPQEQGRGIGTKLLQTIEQECAAARYELFTSNKSIRNIKMYERRGYVKFREQDVAGDLKLVYLEKTEKIFSYKNKITAQEANEIRKSMGWRQIHPEQMQAHLDGSTFTIAAFSSENAIALTTLTWNGGNFATMKIIINPQYQNQGIEDEFISQTCDFLREKLKPGYGIQVDTFVRSGQEELYEKHDFVVATPENTGIPMRICLTNQIEITDKIFEQMEFKKQ